MIKLIELFGGIGTQTMAFENTHGTDNIKCVDLVEWDDKSVDIYNKVHHTAFIGGKEHGDVNNVRGSDIGTLSRNADYQANKDNLFSDTAKYTQDDFNADIIAHNGKDVWVMTCSSPCQSLSNAGKKDGMAPGVNEKSSFLWEGIRILRECYELDPEGHTRQPHYFIIENVVPIHNKNNIGWFNTVLKEIESFGYNNYVMDVNGLDVNEPQMRARTFVVSVLRGVGLPKYIPFKTKDGTAPFKIDDESRISKLKALFNSTSDEDIKEEDDASTKTHKVIIFDNNKKSGVRVTAKFASGNTDAGEMATLNREILAARKQIEKIKKEIDKKGLTPDSYLDLTDENGNKIETEFDQIDKLNNEIDEKFAKLESLKNGVTEYEDTTSSLKDYPFLVKEENGEKVFVDDLKGIISDNEEILDYAIIDISFQSKQGVVDPTHCKIYTDRFPTLLCNTDHIFILDPHHNCMRRILAKEAWLLQTYTDEAFSDALNISKDYLDKGIGSIKSLSALYQSLHKTAGDAILVKAFEKVIENIPVSPTNEVFKNHLASEEIRNKSTEEELQASRDKTWKSASDRYNKNYAPQGVPFTPSGWEDKYTPAERADDGEDATIYSSKNLPEPNTLFDDENAIEETFKDIFEKGNALRESSK
jgi:site-specific DNA-cytosine methylase